MINKKTLPLHQSLLLDVYNLMWFLVLPCLQCVKKIRPHFYRRIWFSKVYTHQPVDIWIQAASSGEAHMANEIIKNWPVDTPATILVTTNTQQGMDILDEALPPAHVTRLIEFFPFDVPSFMEKALTHYSPKVVTLLEAELWPGLLAGCRRHNVPVVLTNGRVQTRNMARYLMFPRFWKELQPEHIYAVSHEDALRFGYVFGTDSIEVMPNIKFDRCTWPSPIPYVHNPVSKLMKAQSQFVVFGSVRKEEESQILDSVVRLLHERPRAIVGIFPRHMHRISAWRQALESAGLQWTMRSKCSKRVNQGVVILWDQFGELEYAYALARGVFVGGTMAPVGGQNFLEPLAQGVVPCIGPHWHNFQWIGQEIIDQGLVQQVNNSDELVNFLLEHIKSPASRNKIHAKFQEYIKAHQGGTDFVIQKLTPYIK
jgi:3-deoxy-D-manno-octulosonic-acid transferase